MIRLTVTALILGLSVAPCLAAQIEQLVESRIVAAGLFKNGLAVINQEIEVSGPGRYRLDDVPVPLHGTWWVESDGIVVTRAMEREFDMELPGSRFEAQRSLAGHEVEVVLKVDGMTSVRGTVVELDLDEPAERTWNRGYEQPAHNYWFGSARADHSNTATPPSSTYLVLDTGGGKLSYIDTSMIAVINDRDSASPNRLKTRVRRPVLVFDVEEAASPVTRIRLSYLTKGIAWAPSYQIDVSDKKRLRLVQKAVVRNELVDLENTEIRLITGFPNVQFGHVTSPLSPATDWAKFFQQLNQQVGSAHAATSNIMTQQAVTYRPGSQGGTLPNADLGVQGVDLYEHSIGHRDLAEGESLALRTADGTAPYERIVEWVVPDSRQADGRSIEEYQRQQNPEKFDDAPWDAIRFKNPLAFPMTTGPAMIVADGRFSGQTMSTFTNPDGEVILHVTKALSVTTHSVEKEMEGEREIISVGGRSYRKVSVEGQLVARSFRGEPISLVVKRRFSGDLLEADHEPAVNRLEQGVYSVNRRQELVWNLSLPPGEEVVLTYRYEVLVHH